MGGRLYEELDHPRMGSQRASTGRNTVLVKPACGKVKAVTMSLPRSGFIYGNVIPHGIGVKEVIMHHEQEHEDAKLSCGPDFKAMNRAACDAGCTNAHEQYLWRKDHLIRLPGSKPLNSGYPLPSHKDPQYTYGSPLGLHVPINKVVEGAYADEWIQMNLVYQKEYPVYDPLDPQYLVYKYTHPKSNRTAQLIKKYCTERMVQKPPKTRFVISRFQNVPKRIDNNNNNPLNRNRPASPFVNFPDPPRLARRLDRPWNGKTLEKEHDRPVHKQQQQQAQAAKAEDGHGKGPGCEQ